MVYAFGKQFGPMASKEYAAVLYHNHNEGLSEQWNWSHATHKVALPPLLDHHALRVIPRPDPPDSNLALEGR